MSPEYNTNIAMRYPANFKSYAIKLRKQGYSLSEISKEIGISKSTASAWAKDVWLDENAKYLLIKKGKRGQLNLI